jgi:hypothetical protein
MKRGWILFIIFYLLFEIVFRIVESMDFVNPERLLVEGVDSKGKPYEKAQNDDKNFFAVYVAHSRESQ